MVERIDIDYMHRALKHSLTRVGDLLDVSVEDEIAGLDALVAVVRTQVAAKTAEQRYLDTIDEGDPTQEMLALGDAANEAAAVAEAALAPFLPQPERAKDGGA